MTEISPQLQHVADRVGAQVGKEVGELVGRLLAEVVETQPQTKAKIQILAIAYPDLDEVRIYRDGDARKFVCAVDQKEAASLTVLLENLGAEVERS